MPDRFGKISIHNPATASPPAQEAEKPSPVPPHHSAKLKKRGLPQRRNPAILWLGAVLIAFGLYNALGFLAVPYYLTNTIPEDFNKKTGMVFDPGQISFNPLTFQFSTENAKILDESGAPLAALQSLSADLAPFSLLRMDLVCNTVTLTSLDLNVTREQDGSYNFDKLIRPKQDGQATDILNFSDLPFLFSLNNIALKNGKILFLDIPTGKTHSIENIQLELPTFSNIPFQANQYLRPSFSAVINGSPVEFSGQAHMGDVEGEKTALTCNLHGIDIPVYAEYFPQNLPLIFTGGKADGKINLIFDPKSQQDDKLAIDFELQLTGIELQNSEATVVMNVPLTAVNGQLKPIAKTMVFTNVVFSEPVVQSVGSTFLSSLSGIFKQPKTNPTTDPAQTGTSFSITVGELLAKDGTFHFWKEKGAKHPEAKWTNLQLSAKDYPSSSPADSKKEPGTFLLTGDKAGTPSSFSWQGSFAVPESIGGILTVSKVDPKDLLMAMSDSANPQLAITGVAGLKGQLTLSRNQDPNTAIAYKLADCELTVQDFQLLEDNLTVLSAPLLKIGSLATVYETIHFGDVSLGNASILLSTHNLPNIFKQFTTGKYLVQDIDFNGQVTLLSDEKGRQKTIYPDVSLQIKDLDTPEKAKENFSIAAKTPSGGAIQGQGDMRLSPFSLVVNTEFNGFAASDILPLLSSASLLNNLTGVLTGKGSLSLPKKNFTGELQLAKASIRKGQESIFSTNEIIFDGVNYTSDPFLLEIASTTINQPQFSWQIGENGLAPMQHFASFFQQNLAISQDAPKESSEQAKAPASQIALREVIFNQGNLLVHDNRLKPKWKGDVSEFSGKIKDVQFPVNDGKSEFSFTGKLQNNAFTLKGAMDVFTKERNGKFQFTLDSFPLASFHQQLSAKTDVNTKSGLFNLQLDCEVKEGRFQNSGSLLFTGVKPISEKSDSALPLALLTDSDEKFRLDFDFIQSDPPGKSVFLEEILALFHTKIVKASASPLLLLSGDYADLLGNELAEFEPGQAELTPKAREVLARYAELLNTHPRLGLEFSGGVDKVIDGPAVKEQLEAAEQKRVDIENQKRYEAWQEEKVLFEQKVAELQKKQAVKGKIAENNIPPAVLKNFIPLQPKQITVDEATLLDLAKKRGQLLYQFLTEQLAIQPERLAVIPVKRLANAHNGPPSGNGIKIAPVAIK
ncbi:MAG: DUF748 domain-containing protein [Desulforhopalus sp.]|nr:DUF748 domain-containing protein [Desulforhopalus sp.]